MPKKEVETGKEEGVRRRRREERKRKGERTKGGDISVVSFHIRTSLEALHLFRRVKEVQFVRESGS